jgi:putative ABC transport system permease protein
MSPFLHRLAARARALFHPAGAERDLNEELQGHLERHVEELIAQGLPIDAARVEARRAFGGLAQAEEACRDARGVRALAELSQDLRYGIRMMRRAPGATFVIIVTLGVAIGANVAIFSLFNAVLLKALPLPHPDRLVVITEETPTVHGGAVSYPDFLDWRARQTMFEHLAISMVIGGVLTGDGNPERVFGRAVSADFFSTLGSALALGRTFTEAEDRPGGDRAIIISYPLWLRHYHGDPTIVGRAVQYNGEPYTMVGVLPPRFDYYGSANANNDIFVALGKLADQSYLQKRDSHPGLVAIGRLKSGVRITEANADLARIAASLSTEYPSTNANVGVAVRSLLDDYVGDVRQTLWVLLASAVFVLTIACANVANLLLARSAARTREVAMRLALGAGRQRIVRQLLTESLLLACVGGALGILLGWWGRTTLATIAARTLPRMDEVALDWRVVGFTVGATALAAVFFGLLPAWQATRVDVQPALKDGSRSIVPGGHVLRDALVIAQIALSVALLVAAGLLLRSFTHLVRVDPGYDARGVLTLRLRLPDASYRDGDRVAATLDEMLARVETLAGVDRACLTTGVPFGRAFPDPFELDGRPAPSGDRAPLAWTQWVTAGYFDTLRIGLVAGRTFSAADREHAPLVALIDEDFARAEFAGRGPAEIIGQRIRFPRTDDRWRTIVGIVRHVRHNALDEPSHAQAYGPYDQLAPAWKTEIGRAMDAAVRSSLDPATVAESIKAEVHAVAPDVALSHVRTLHEATSLSIAPRVLNLSLVGLFSAAALLLCLVGVYGMMSHSVAARTREIGVRLALGAAPRGVLTAVVVRGIRLAAVGAVMGIVLAAILGQSLQAMLYSVKPRDPLTFAMVAALLVIVAAAGSYVPALRAMRVDPLAALRHE